MLCLQIKKGQISFFPRTSGWHYAELGFRNTSIWLCIFFRNPLERQCNVIWGFQCIYLFVGLFLIYCIQWFIRHLSDASDGVLVFRVLLCTAEIYSMNVSLLAHSALFFDVMNPHAFLPHHPQNPLDQATSTVWQEWDPVSCSVPVCVIKYCCVRENDRQFRND